MSESSYKTIHILLVEDSDESAMLTAINLKKDGHAPYRLTHKTTLKEATAILITDPPDAVLLDLNLPDSVGLDSFHAIFQTAPSVPIIILSGQDDPGTAAKAVHLGAQDYISKKEVTTRSLFQTVLHCIERATLLEKVRKAEEDAKQQSQFKTEFLAHMSHEIRTPLNGIMGAASLLAHTVLNDEQRDLLQTMQDSGQRLLGLVRQILEISRMETGQPHAGTASLSSLTPNDVPFRIARAPSSPESHTILVVDDGEVNLKLATKMLDKLGYKVETALDGEKAIEAARLKRYDVILMDCRMPRVDGFAATKAIRVLPAPSCDTPIVAMTANAFDEDRDQCIQAGMNDFLPKPILLDNLANMLEKWIAGPKQPKSMSAIDKNTLLELSKLEQPGDHSFLNELIDTFLEHAPPLLGNLVEALENHQPKVIRHCSHKLKGFARNLGALTLAKLCESVEARWEAIPEGEIPKLVESLKTAYHDASTELESRWKISAV